MGACCSNEVKADRSMHSVNPTNVSSSNGNFPASQPPTRSEIEILRAYHLKTFTYDELRMATGNFRDVNLLGKSCFGSVFKGWFDEYSLAPTRSKAGLATAVKRCNNYGSQVHKEWLAEMNYLGQLQHPNLVKLIGHCIEDDQRLVVYEFVPLGSVESHLFEGDSKFQPLSWSIRMKVALGAAKGLAFLHMLESQVIYRDFKTSDILLDLKYNAKLSDFGLARDGPIGEKTHVSTGNNSAYAAPEYHETGYLSTKSDVYSFGVVLVELLTGRKALDWSRPKNEQILVEWAKPYLTHKRKIFQVLDTRLLGKYSSSQAKAVADLALKCLSRDSKLRPTMDEVVTTLEELPDMVEGALKHKEGEFQLWKCWAV